MPILAESSYRAPWYARHNLVMFLWANFLRRVPKPMYSEVERIPTPPGQQDSFIQLAWSKVHPTRMAERAVLLAPGLEGGSSSKPVSGMVRALNQEGFDVAVWIYRDTGGEYTRQRSTYSGYGLEDLDRAIARLAYGPNWDGHGYDSISLVGLSLGANIVLQYLEQCQVDRVVDGQPDSAQIVDKILAISPPVDFGASVEYWSQALMGRLVISPLSVRSMRRKAKAKRAAKGYPSRSDVRAYGRVKTVSQADHLINTDLNGFASAVDYWSRATTTNTLWPQQRDGRHEPRNVETLVLSARDDFLLDSKSYPVDESIDETVTFDLPANGSHIGFVPRGRNKQVYWSEDRAIEFLD